MVRVLRSGRSREISLFEVCVGDLLHLEPGDVVPVDGVLIDGYGVRCDEASATGESDLQTKTPADEVMQSLENGTGYPHLDPFILSGAIVAEGIGVCLVTAVGVHSSLGKLLMSLGLKSDETPLTEQVMKFVRMVRKASSLYVFFPPHQTMIDEY
jgi:Ca2+-transporting ATPase